MFSADILSMLVIRGTTVIDFGELCHHFGYTQTYRGLQVLELAGLIEINDDTVSTIVTEALKH
jgi:hypothetical protein